MSLSVEQLESRDTPSSTPFAGDVVLARGVVNPLQPPPVQGQDGSIAFVPPGVTRGFQDPNLAPPPVQVRLDGSIAFVPPGVTRGIIVGGM
jgi:hypothetical protein